MNILLVDRLVPEAQSWLEERHSIALRPDLAADTAALRKAVHNAEAVVLPRKVAVTDDFLNAAPLLKAIARLHDGSDNTDLEACRDRDVRVIQASSASVRSNAEYLLASLLLLYRQGLAAPLLGERHAELRLGREINGSVIGIFGLAPAAHTLTLMLHSLGAKLIGYDPAVHHTAPIWSRLKLQPVSLQELMATSDAVSVQVIYASRYRGFINDNVLAHCKPKQLWVGISRSQLFDPVALAEALADGRIEGCMLDGAEAGFASRGSPLHDSNNLYLTPRLGSHTREAQLRASWYVAHRIHQTLAAPEGTRVDQMASVPAPLTPIASTAPSASPASP